ncbi:MAG TPA: hypothetical protein VFH27_00480 [Longimicrobiaceae bacterium]|nr:hypothetical protein [Longimicrobiaceae bacterium]
MSRRPALLLLALLIVPAALPAQVVSPIAPDTVKTDTLRQERPTHLQAMRDSALAVGAFDESPEQAGRRAGRAAGAHGGGIRWRAGTSFMVGIPLGVAAPLGLLGHEPYSLAGTAVGTLVIAKLGSGTGKFPPRLARAAEARGTEYAQAFRQSYGERIHKRRRRATVIGGLIGGVVGLAVLAGASVALAPIG